MSKHDQLYGKALTTLVIKALSSLNTDHKHVVISDISTQILEDRPYLFEYIRTPADAKKLHLRITNCVKQLNKADVIEIEKKQTPITGFTYYIVYTKIK